MSDIERERFHTPGFECGECGGWANQSDPTPCKGRICGPNGIYAKEKNEESDSGQPRDSK